MSPRPDILTHERVEQAFQAQGQASLSLVRLDLDHFATVNQTLGHTEGDRVLREVERLLAGSLPGGSLIARTGGDEYALLLPETAPETALLYLDEIIKHFQIHRDPLWPRGLGISAGIAARPPHGTGYAELMRAADEALLRAKHEGRSRACLYVESRMVLKSNYYPKSQLERLSRLADAQKRTEAALLREALDTLLDRHRDLL